MSSARDPRFSVIIPAYNAAGTIRRSLQSVVTQSFPAFEIIVVNDGSTDDTEKIILDQFGSIITYIHLTANTGPAHARNAGLSAATGTHIAFQDADDVWHPGKLQIIASLLLQYPETAFLYHPYTLAAMDFDPAVYPITLSGYPFSKLLLSNPIGTPCVIMSRNDTIRFDETMHYMEDYDLFLREGYKHGIKLLNIPLTQLGRPILSAGGQSSKRWEMRKGEFRAYSKLIKLNPLFLFISLGLIVLGLIKHGVKSFFPPRANY